jgi:hypothetical protein
MDITVTALTLVVVIAPESSALAPVAYPTEIAAGVVVMPLALV